MPRPIRLRALRADAGFRFERFSCSAIVLGLVLLALDADEVANLPQHTGDLRALRALDRAADLAQPERAQRSAMALGLADLAADLGDLQGLTHSGSPPPARLPPAPAPESAPESAPAPPAA